MTFSEQRELALYLVRIKRSLGNAMKCLEGKANPMLIDLLTAETQCEIMEAHMRSMTEITQEQPEEGEQNG